MVFLLSRRQSVFSKLHCLRLKQGWRFPAVCAAFLLMLLGAAQGQQCSNAEFVQRVYSDLLFRQPTASEITFYAIAAQSNGRQPVALSLIGSQEFNIDLIGANPSVVSGFYQTFLGRNPTVTEAQFTLALEPTNDSSIISFLLGSAEYRLRAIQLNPGIVSNDQKLVNQMLHDLLGRNATASELDFFAGQLGSGTPASTIANAILGSNEYFSALINRAYLRMLRRAATQSEINFFLTPLRSDARPQEDLLSILAGSAEYCNQAGVQPPPVFILQTPSDVFSGLNSITLPENLATLPAVQFGPFEAAANASILTLQGMVAADDATITLLNASIERLNGQIATLNTLLAGQAQAITDLTNTLFGAPPTLSAAEAAQNDAQEKIALALASVGASNPLVQNAQSDLSLGDAALKVGDYSTAVKRYRLAFLLAGNALR
jgi:hypothetical protein